MRVLAVLVVIGCSSKSEPPPAPRPAVVIIADAAQEPAPTAVMDAAPTAVIDAPLTAEELETAAIMKKVMSSPPCCCALASTLPELQTQPHMYCEQDLHGTCVAAAGCPAKGTLAATIEAWFLGTAAGATALTGYPFNAEIQWDDRCKRPHEIHAVDGAALTAEAECLVPVLAEALPAHRGWKTGWGCAKRSTTELGKRIYAELGKRGDTLRCATKKIHAGFDTFGTLGVFVAVRDGKITALLISN